MTAVFSHGRLRLYLLKLLAEGPKHGYELIRLLENRFLGLYAPSAGTIYPRLARLEVEGLVTHTQAGGRKVYEITNDGRTELAQRAGELAELETEIHASVADLTTLATEIEQHVSGSVRDLKRELRDATRQIRTGRPWTDGRPWQRAAGGRTDPGASPADPTRTAPADPTRTAPADSTGTVEGARADRAKPGDRPAPGSAATDSSGTNGSAAGDLERAVEQLTSEVRRMTRQGAAGDAQLRAAAAVVSSALTELRRLLRG